LLWEDPKGLPDQVIGAAIQPGGLDILIDQFKKNGFEDVINSWIGKGQNQAISPTELRRPWARRRDLSRQVGTPQEDLVSQRSRYLPGVIDQLTPNGRLPNQADLRSGYRRNQAACVSGQGCLFASA
jgi:uncharacterized protein YidB (DUF937 family)